MTTTDDIGADALGDGEGFARAAASLRAADLAAQGLSRSLAEGFRSAVREAAAGGARLGDVVRRLAADMAAAGVAAAARPVGDALGRGVAGLVAAAVGAAAGGTPVSGPVRAFAKGGVIHGARRFPLGDGVGLAGEAGPEAILPLARGPDGRLGVRAGGGGVRVTLNVATPDADSFGRSRGQIAAALARAVALGQRRL
jgi:phage-related minor tail protein